MAVFRYEGEAYGSNEPDGPHESYEPGQYVRHADASPGNGLDPVVEIVEDLGTIEVPCGKVDCRSNCLEYTVRPVAHTPEKLHAPQASQERNGRSGKTGYNLAECKIWPLVSIL